VGFQTSEFRSTFFRVTLNSSDTRLGVGKNRHAAVLAPRALAEAILAAGLAAAFHRDIDLAAMEDVDRKARGRADGPMKRRRAVDAHNHRRRLHTHGGDGSGRHSVPGCAVMAGQHCDRSREPAKRELGLRRERVVQGRCGLHARSPIRSRIFIFDAVLYRMLQRTVRYSIVSGKRKRKF
jgi:hypothetical protein